MRVVIGGIATFILTLSAISPAAEFCTSLKDPLGAERSCNAALTDGFGGIIVFEREPAPKAHLQVVAQWLDGDFKADGGEIVVEGSTTGPMWRPQAILLDGDTALIVWADGTRFAGDIRTYDYRGMEIRGTVLKRGDKVAAKSFPLLTAPDASSGVISPELKFDPVTNTGFVAGWQSGGGRMAMRSLSFSVADVMAFAKGTVPRLAATEMAEPNMLCTYTMGSAGKIVSFTTTGVPLVGILGTGKKDTRLRLTDAARKAVPGAWFDQPSAATSPAGSTALAAAILSGQSPKGYIVEVLSPEGKTTHCGIMLGGAPADANLARPLVAFSNEYPVAFLPVMDEKGSLQLLVAPIPTVSSANTALSARNGDLYPLPGDLQQFSIAIADNGASGKAAIIASSGTTAAPHVCIWPSEFIGFAAED